MHYYSRPLRPMVCVLVLVLTTFVITQPRSAKAATVSWATNSSGFWDVAENWSNGKVPGPNDDVVLDRGTANPTITIRSGIQSVRSLVNNEALVLSAGTLSVAEASNSDGSFAWTGGTLKPAGGLTNAGTMNWSGGHLYLDGGTLANTGRINWTSGVIHAYSSAILDNQVGGIFDIQTDSTFFYDSFYGTGMPRLENGGIVRKSAGLNTASLSLTVSGGNIEVQSGTLALNGAGTTTSGGHFVVAEGATLDLTGNTSRTYTGIYTGSGAGAVRLTSGTLLTDATGATFNFPGTLFQWTGGTLKPTGDVTNAGTMNWSGGHLYLDGGTLANTGRINWTGGVVHAYSSAILDNQADGIFDIQTDSTFFYDSFYGTGMPRLENGGLIRKSAGLNTASLSLTVSGGNIEVQSGTLALNGAGTTTSGGHFVVAEGATLDLTGNTSRTYTGIYTGSGAGAVRLTSGTLLTGATGATFNFPGTLFQWTGGTLKPGGDVTNAGTMNWSGGHLYLDGGMLANTGRINWTSGVVHAYSSAILDNQAGGIFDIQTDSTFFYDAFYGTGMPRLENAGIVRKSAGPNTANLQLTVSGGRIEVQSGTLALNGAGTTTSGGHLVVAEGATLDLTGNTSRTYIGIYTGSGAGAVRLSHGTLLTGATGATFNFPGTLFQWTGGTLKSGGDVTNAGTMSWSGGHLYLDGGMLANTGRINWTSGVVHAYSSAVLNNQAGGIFDIQTDSTFFYDAFYGEGAPTLTNAGLIRKTEGINGAAVSVRLNNTGVVEARSGTLTFNGGVEQAVGGTLTGGAWNVFAGATLAMNETITSNDATIVLDGAGATFPAINNLATNTGDFSLRGGANWTVSGAFDNQGRLLIGPGSTFAVNGNYTQGEDARLVVGIAAEPASGQFGRLTTGSVAALDGTLSVYFVGGFSPATTHRYQVMSFGSRSGDFAELRGAVGGRTPAMEPVFADDGLFLNSLREAIDLAVATVEAPTSAAAGENVTVRYSVSNQTDRSWSGSWIDAVYISTDRTFDPSDKLLGRVEHTGVAPNGVYNKTLTAPMPGYEGEFYVIVIADSRGLAADLERANNQRVSANAVISTIRLLSLDQTFSGTIANGQERYFRVDGVRGRDLRLTATLAVPAEVEFYVRLGNVPDRANYDFVATNIFELRQEILLMGSQDAPYYILLVGREPAGTDQSFTLTAAEMSFELRSHTPDRGSNAGTTTMTLVGSGFSGDTTVRLVASNGSERAATKVLLKDNNTLFATFDLRQLMPGRFGIRLVDGDRTVTRDDVFTVTTGAAGRVDTNVFAPFTTRPWWRPSVTVEYQNTGDADVAAPWFVMRVTNGLFVNADGATSATVQFLGINTSGPAGVLPPGARNRRDFVFQPNPITTGTEQISFELIEITEPGRFFDMVEMKADLKPAYVPAAAWDAVFANFTARAGANLERLHTVLAEDATYLSTFDDLEWNITSLLYFELGEAGLAEITPRHLLGAFGRGRLASWEITATSNATGQVRVQAGQGLRVFQRQENGTYRGVPGDWGVLRAENGIVTLREQDGSIMAFHQDGKLNYFEDSNGDRLSYQYTGALVTGRTYPNGDVEQIAYNAQGRVARITDEVGRVTTFEYDASGEHLTSTTTPQGTTRYVYATAPGASQHALTSITGPDDVTQTYTYDTRGLLSGGELPGGVDRFTVTRTPGCQTVTNAVDSSTHACRDGAGLLRRSIDPLGQVTRMAYDANRNLTKVNLPDGSAYQYVYDERGNLVSQIDPLGRRTRVTYDTALNRLRTFTDALGHTTTYAYDDGGNLTSITYPDGARETFTYGQRSLLTSWTNRRNQTVTFAYDAKDNLIAKRLPAAEPSTFTYDAHRNVTAVTRGGATTSYTYDAKDQLTRVSYPQGRFLEFDYDAGGRRTRMEDQTGVAVTYQYDGAGRLARLADGANTTLATYTYDAASRLVGMGRGNGTQATYEYDAVGRLLSLRNLAPDGGVQSRFAYTYDIAGRPISMTTEEGTASFTYDAAGQLIETRQPDNRTIAYRYDAAGNRQRVTDNGGSTNYTVNALNQYTSAGAATYGYDADGNLSTKTVDGQVTRFNYDAENRLTAISGPKGEHTFEYDAHEMLGAAVVDGTRTEYLRDPMGLTDVVAEYTGGGALQARYVYGIGLVSRSGATGPAAYYGFDGTGNTAQLTDASGGISNSYSYLPFGERRTATGSTPNTFTFSGQWGVAQGIDSLHYMRARWYDAESGRFLSPDPIGVDGGDANSYRYVSNSPVALIDPSGLQGWYGNPGGGYYPGSNVPMQGGDWLGDQAARPAETMTNTNQGRGLSSNARAGEYARPGLDNQVTRGQTPPNTAPNSPPSTGAAKSGLRGGARTGFKSGAKNFLKGAAKRAGPIGQLATVAELSYGGTRLILENTEWGRKTDQYVADKMQDWWFDDIPTDPVLEKRIRERIEFCNDPANAADPKCTGKRKRPGGGTTNRVSGDPNDIVGPEGFGAERWITGAVPLPYTIRFENKPDAAAPATFITVVQQLDPDFDLTTIELGDLGWADVRVVVPTGRSTYSTRVDLRETLGLFVDVTGSIDATTGRITWSLTAIDPATGELPGPESQSDGFLFPNDATHRGEGFVSYRVRPKVDAPTGTRLDAQARIVFDTNDPIDTPAIFNTLDMDAPVSTVAALPARTAGGDVAVSWSGNDGTGSGMRSYDVFVSVDDGPFTAWLLGTTATSATYRGAPGHTYGFFSVATDNVGRTQAAPTVAQASTTTADILRLVFLPFVRR